MKRIPLQCADYVLRDHIATLQMCFNCVCVRPRPEMGRMFTVLKKTSYEKVRVLTWRSGVSEMAVFADDSSEDECWQAILGETRDIVIVAHNGIKFDFPFLCNECVHNAFARRCSRNGSSWTRSKL